MVAQLTPIQPRVKVSQNISGTTPRAKTHIPPIVKKDMTADLRPNFRKIQTDKMFAGIWK